MQIRAVGCSSSHRHPHVALGFVGALATACLMGSIVMYNSEEAYESSGTASQAATRAVRLEIKDGAAVTTLAGLSPGQYAIKAFHDLNGDSKLNTNLFGIPIEPVAFSNDAPVHMRAPSWKETVFVVYAGENAISIHID
jgi:uncharacterized protein (DUF2141 family)